VWAVVARRYVPGLLTSVLLFGLATTLLRFLAFRLEGSHP
jgi:hypothetical protein